MRVAILVGDQLGTTRYARRRTTCVAEQVMHGREKPADRS
jgi:hypothetical protein